MMWGQGFRLAAGPGVPFRGAGVLPGVLTFRVHPHFPEHVFESAGGVFNPVAGANHGRL